MNKHFLLYVHKLFFNYQLVYTYTKLFFFFFLQQQDCDLLTYLKSSTEGKALLATYNTSGLLDNSGRRKICNLIVRRELQDDHDKCIKTQRFLTLAQEITIVFPKEHISTYFIPYMNYGQYLSI